MGETKLYSELGGLYKLNFSRMKLNFSPKFSPLSLFGSPNELKYISTV